MLFFVLKLFTHRLFIKTFPFFHVQNKSVEEGICQARLALQQTSGRKRVVFVTQFLFKLYLKADKHYAVY